MSRFHRRIATALAVFATVVPAPALAQQTTLPSTITKVSSEPTVIVSQLQTALAEEKRALAIYQAAAPTDDLSEGHQAALNAYVAIRSARSGMSTLRGKKKFVDPVLDLAYQKVDRAWNRSRAPVDHMPPPGNLRPGYLVNAARQMNDVIGWLEQVLLMWP
jgi:hypothetical protein